MRSADSTRTEHARRLRRKATFEEQLLWFRLRNRQCGGWKIVRQEPIGPYVADFCCRERKLVIEVDGGQHAGSIRDAKRDAWLRSQGFNVVRVSNQQVRFELDSVLETILALLDGRLTVGDLS
jgi:very-short-patch-repair endonuclease